MLTKPTDMCTVKTRSILEQCLEGKELSQEHALHLLGATGNDYLALLAAAHAVCEMRKGRYVTFVICRNINFTNQCIHSCRFCAFSVPVGHPDGMFLSFDGVARKVHDAVERGCTEVCMQGGLHPSLTLSMYVDLLRSIRSVSRDIHIHAFSPEEIRHAALQSSLSCADVLAAFKEAGLNSMPGTAAEILVDGVRRRLCPGKLSTSQWREIIITAHKLGIPSTATIMYGHIESLRDRVEHLSVLREIQKETGGFTEFVPLPFLAAEVKRLTLPPERAAGYGMDDLRLFAVARLFFQGQIDNIQCSWVKLGPRFAQTALYCGVNDFSGTLFEENITKSAGGTFGECMAPEVMIAIIGNAGKIPVQRDTLYNHLKVYD